MFGLGDSGYQKYNVIMFSLLSREIGICFSDGIEHSRTDFHCHATAASVLILRRIEVIEFCVIGS